MLWLRVDPEYQWVRQLVMEQPDSIWHNMLKYERDVLAQVEVGEPSCTIISYSGTTSIVVTPWNPMSLILLSITPPATTFMY